MKKVALVIDNSAAMSEEDIKRADVKAVVPISFIVNGEEYYEGKNMTYAQFYDFLKDKSVTVGTSQPSCETVKEVWRDVLKENDELVYILLSSGLSEACNTALNASHDDEFEGRVFVVNNQRVSYMNKMAMFEAHELIKQGKSAKEIKQYLEETKCEVGAYIAVDTLRYLKKGGRVTPAAAAIGSLLNIKPVLQLHNGKLDAFAKVMSMKQAKVKLISSIRKEIEDKYMDELNQGKLTLSVAHTFEDPNSSELKEFVEEVKATFSDMPFFVCDPLPLFVACHTGPKALALGYAVDRLGIVTK